VADTAYATIDDLGTAWKNLTGDQRDDVEAALEEASRLVDVELAEHGIEPDDVAGSVLKIVVCRMVRRAYPANQTGPGLPPGVESTQVSLGSFQQTLRWGDGRAGELLVYRNERRMLGIRPRAFMIDLLDADDSKSPPGVVGETL